VWLFGVQLEGELLLCAEEVALALAQQLADHGALAVECVTCDGLLDDDDEGDGSFIHKFWAEVQVAGKEEVCICVGYKGTLDFGDEDEDEGYWSN
jgi:hypothetical protein